MQFKKEQKDLTMKQHSEIISCTWR